MKKFLAIALSLMMIVGLAACGGSSSSKKEVEYPTRDITVLCPNAAGGPMDLSTRLGTKYLEKYLGVTVTVSNVTGGNNWTAWGQAIEQGADGYTLAFVNFPNQFNYLLYKDIPYTYESFSYISNVVHDPNVIVVSQKHHGDIKTLADLIKLGKERNDIVLGTGGLEGSDDDILIQKMNATYGTHFVSSRIANSTEGYNAMLGGTVWATVANVSEVYYRYKDTSDKDTMITVLAVFDEVRSDLIPDIPTAKEQGFDGVYGSSDRGLAASNKIDPAIRAKLIEVFEKAAKDPDFVKDVADQGMTAKVVLGDDYTAVAKDIEQTMKTYYGDILKSK